MCFRSCGVFPLVDFPTTGIKSRGSDQGKKRSSAVRRVIHSKRGQFSSYLFLDMTTLKLDVPLFDGRVDFSLWQCTIQDYLVQQGLDCALGNEKPSEMKDSEWSTIQKRQ